jgi:hypothetical protein
LWDFFHSPPRLIRQLPHSIPGPRRNEVAAILAREAAVLNSNQLRQVVTLAATWSEIGEPREAIRILGDAYDRRDEYKDSDDALRVLLSEAGVASGEDGDALANTSLSAYSLSDALNPTPLTDRNAKEGLAQLGLAFTRLVTTGRELHFGRGVRAAAVLGTRTDLDVRTRDFFKQHTDTADRYRIPHPSTDEALEWLTEEANRAFASRAAALGSAVFQGPLTFHLLASVLGVDQPQL